MSTIEARRLRDDPAAWRRWGPYPSERAWGTVREDYSGHTDPSWHRLLPFHEHFHGDDGTGLGASHQTGRTGLVANLIVRRNRKGISR